MAHRQFHARGEALEKVLRGATALADAVRVTLGPKSRCVLIERKYGRPIVCNDGVTIAKEFELADHDENLGAQMIREAAERTGEAVGDGTTTSTILAHAIFAEGVRNVAAGASAIDLRRGLDRGLAAALASLKSQTRPVGSRMEKEQVATISAHNDSSIGRMVADAVERVGADGAIHVEDAKGTSTVLEVVEGMKFDRGYVSPYFVTDTRRMECVLESPLILLSDRKVAAVEAIVPILESVLHEGRALLLVAEEVEGEALATLVVNRVRGALSCAAVRAPGYGENRKQMLDDIAVLTGAKLVSEEMGVKMENVTIADLGTATRVVVGKDDTTIIGGKGDLARIHEREEQLRAEIERSTSGDDRDKLKERLARLAGGVAVIRVGAPSEAEMKSRKEALEDAISATRAALAEGILPGAGLGFLRAIPAVEAEEQAAEGDERTGLRMLKHALETPTRQIAINSGFDGGVVVEKMRNGTGAFGFDAGKGIWGDLLASGIVDATKVVRLALENAVSVAGTLLLTEATLTEVPEKETHAAPAYPADAV